MWTVNAGRTGAQDFSNSGKAVAQRNQGHWASSHPCHTVTWERDLETDQLYLVITFNDDSTLKIPVEAP